MIKQILGKLPRKTSSKSSRSNLSNEGVFNSVSLAGGGGVSNSSKTSSDSKKGIDSGSGASRYSNNGTRVQEPVSTSVKLNQEKKLGPMGLQGDQGMNHAVYEALPSFKDVPSSEKHDLFIRKLSMCCIVFDFADPSKNLKEKDIKRQTLLELVDYISSVTSKFNEITMLEITKMIGANLFRALPNHDNKLPYVYDPEDEELTLEPSWPHLQIVYEFLLRFVASPEADAKLAKRYIDQSFILRLLDLFDSDDQREKEYLKRILHRIYGKFMVHRPFIRKSINNVFYNFIFETDHHNGIAELLEILGSIINGFALPLKEEHKLFLVRALVPLHKPKSISMYHQQLSYCIAQFVEKDSKLADPVIRGLLKYWPITNSSKEIMFLGELEEVLEATQAAEFQKCMVPLFRQIGRCLNSSHFQVAERALFLWNNDHISTLITQNRKVILLIILPALESNTGSHWNQAVQSLTHNVKKIFSDADQALYDDCLSKFQEDQMKGKETLSKRVSTWKRLEDVAASKAGSNGALLDSSFASVTISTSTDSQTDASS